MRKLSIRLSDDLSERLKEHAARNGRSVQKELELLIGAMVSGEVERGRMLMQAAGLRVS